MKGILFKEEDQFNLVIEGRKIQTRRVIKTKAENIVSNTDGTFIEYHQNKADDYYTSIIKPRYKVGEIVYLKEPYCEKDDGSVAWYKFDLEDNSPHKHVKNVYTNKTHMPEKNARYFIKIKGVRVERLQDISNADIISEGIGLPIGTELAHGHVTEAWNRNSFEIKWDSINKPPHSYEDNPFNWVYEFELLNQQK